MAASDWDDLVERFARSETEFLEADRLAAEIADDDVSDDALALNADLETVRRLLRELKGDIAAVRVVDPVEWYRSQLRLEQQRRRHLEVALVEERRRAWRFTDEAVIGALERAYEGEPVSATAVVSLLLDDPPHHAKIRTGFALSRLAAAGRVVKLSGPRQRATAPHLWRPCHV